MEEEESICYVRGGRKLPNGMCANNVFHKLIAESNSVLFMCCTVIKDTLRSIWIR